MAAERDRPPPWPKRGPARPYFLAHHPLCTAYRADVLSLGRHYLCLGCLITYPTAALLVAAYLVWPPLQEPFFLWWLVPGLAGGGLQLLSQRGLTRSRPAKVGVKLALGMGLGSMTLVVFGLPGPFWYRLLLFVACLQGLSLMGARREKTITARCMACPYRAQWHLCPGFSRAPLHPRDSPEGPLPSYPLPAPGLEPAAYRDPRSQEELELPRPLP